MKKAYERYFRLIVTREQCKDTGMAFTLIFVLLRILFDNDLFLIIAALLLAIAMAMPMFFKSLAIIWYGVAKILGHIISNLILSVIFTVVVTPVAVIRRLMGKDSLRLNEFKKSNGSVMEKRNIIFGPQDIEEPF